jgi:hypothetical protein
MAGIDHFPIDDRYYAFANEKVENIWGESDEQWHHWRGRVGLLHPNSVVAYCMAGTADCRLGAGGDRFVLLSDFAIILHHSTI